MKQSKVPQELPLLKLIGKGSFSEVSLLHSDGLPVACKSVFSPLSRSSCLSKLTSKTYLMKLAF